MLAAVDWSVVLCGGRSSPHRPILALLLVPLSSPLPPLAFCMRGAAGSRCAHHVGGALWPIRPLLRCGAYAWPSVWCGGGGSRLRPCQALPLASLSSPLPPFAFCTRGGVGGRLSCCMVPYDLALWSFVPRAAIACPEVLCEGGSALHRPYQALPLASLSSLYPCCALCPQGGGEMRSSPCYKGP